ncbi:MAG: hypothetical protein PVH62_09910 [Anaerolineae bacterium]|jgi:uncharacterized membrane protein YozB (DUF420 family)
MEGFLGTRAELGSDLALVFTLTLGVAAVAGWLRARRRRFPFHCRLMAVAALANWAAVLSVMLPPWISLARSGTAAFAGTRTFVPLVHGAAGVATQLLMTYTVVRMYWLKRLPPRRTHRLMVVALLLWVLTSIGGTGVYLLLYVS